MPKLAYVMIDRWTPETGVGKKIRNELKAFELNGIKTEVIEVKEKKKWQKVLPFSATHRWEDVNVNDADYIYVRHETINAPFIRFLRRCKKKNPDAKIIMEIGTYPYLDELKKISNPLTIARDCFYQRFLKKYVKRITTITDLPKIFGIPVIELVNCIDVDTVQLPRRKEYRGDQVINVISVASVHYYYAFDRFLRGLATYYQKPQEYEVRFHLVGDGPVLNDLKQLSKELQLEKYVTFYGFRTGEALDEIYEFADIGIDVLGLHRKNLDAFGTLKSREYMSKGLPFITEAALPEVTAPIRRYIHKVSNDERDINVEEVVEFFQSISESKECTIKEMRDFAYSYCDIRVAMNPIINYLKG